MSAVLTDAVAAAIAALKEDYEIEVEHTGDGGALITVHRVEIGLQWDPAIVEVEFLLPYNYPFAAIYPYYTTETLGRADGAAWPGALQHVAWRGRRVVQISLRASRWNPHVDTAHGAIAQVIRWFNTT